MKSIKKFLPLFALLSIGLFFTPDILSILTYVYRLAVIGIITLASIWIVGEVDDWGIFPDVNFKELIVKAKSSALGAATIFASLVYLIVNIFRAVIG